MGGLDGCRGGGGRLSLVVLVSEKSNLVSEKSGKSQGILFICGAGNPGICPEDGNYSVVPTIGDWDTLSSVIRE